MDPGVVDGLVTLVIRAPNQKYTDQTINCCQSWTVEKLKAHLSDVYPSKPVSIWLQSTETRFKRDMKEHVQHLYGLYSVRQGG